jgi:cytochrome P450
MSVLYDPRRPEFIADPYPVFHRLQAEDPVHWSGVLGGWVLTRDADVKAALNDGRLSSDRITPFLRHQAGDGRPGLGELGRLIGLWAVFTDPPRHTRLRALMNTAFTARAVERLRPRIAAIVAALLDEARVRGTMDVIRHFAYPLPITVIAEMIGVPPEDREPFKGWSDELAQFEPDRLDLARANNRHIAFGYGIHFCMGAPLARLEAQIALPALLTGLPGLALTDGERPWLASLVFRGMTSLPVAWDG